MIDLTTSILKILIWNTLFFILTHVTYGVTGGQSTESDDRRRGPIFLQEPPSSLVIPNTKGGLVPCAVFGNPPPRVYWINSDGIELENRSGVVEVLANNSLFFHPFEPGDIIPAIHTQRYRCVAENVIGRVYSRAMRTAAVNVEQLERFSVNLNSVWVMRGGTAVFRCEINPLFVKEYVTVTSWKHSNSKEDRISITKGGELHLRDVRALDGYKEFRCTATCNITNTERMSLPARLNIHDPPAGGKSPSIEDYLYQAVEADVGARVELTCVSDGSPLPTYRWFKDNTVVNMQDTRYSQLGGNLVIDSSLPSDSGEYRCNVSNSRGSAAAIRQLTVKVKLSATIKPPEQKIDSGDSAMLNCTGTGNPITSVEWYKDGVLMDGGDERVVFENTETLLRISDFRRHDQGMYQCFMLNSDTEVQATSQLLLGVAHPAISGFGDQFVPTGQRKSMRCIATGNPTPTIRWLLDGEPVREQSHVSVGDFTMASGDVVSDVNITRVNRRDGGEYTCIATNKVGQADHTARLNVYGIPFIREMKNVTATANEPLSIRCYVTGYPYGKITWSRDGRQLPLNHLQQVVNGTLIILKVQKHFDEGKYTCSVVNSGGMGMDRSVYVSVVEPPVIDPFRIPPRKQGDRVTLSCAVSSGDLPINITWSKDDSLIPPGMGIVVETSGPYSSLLKIGDVSPNHDGNYTCHASNLAASTSYTAELHVNVPPRWVHEPEDTEVIRSKSVFINCMAAGIPDPSIRWSKEANTGKTPQNYIHLDPRVDDDYRIHDNGTLEIREAQEKNDGNYLCQADNGIGHGISSIIYLTVHVPARFDVSGGKNYSVNRGHNKSMDCQAIGDQPLSVSWNFKNSTVGDGTIGRHTVIVQSTSRGKLSQMVLRPALRADTGLYTCTAKNGFGYDSMSMWLIVLEPPDAPANLTITDIQSRFVVLSWEKPFNGNSPLSNYVIEYENTTDKNRGPVRNISVAGNLLSTTLEHLHPAFRYNIRIRANNSIGLGLTSHQVTAVLLEEAPSGPPLDVEVTAIGSQKLRVTWRPPSLGHRNGIILGYVVRYKETHSTTPFTAISKDIVMEDGPEDMVSVLIPNLKKFTEYTVNVACHNEMGVGPNSPDIKVSTLEDVPSQPPEGVQAFALSSQAIKVIWGPPPLFTLHGVLQGYKVLYKPVRMDEDETDASHVRSTNLEVTIDSLEKYTNYSIQVLAFTRKGEGVRSNAIFVITMEDVPGRPAGIKGLPINNSSVLVSWQQPHNPNGAITTYNIYFSNTSATAQEVKIEVEPTDLTFVLTDLEGDVNYWVRVTASTRMGEGESTQIVTVMPINRVPARITSFSHEFVASWQDNLLLPCGTVGEPSPDITWMTRLGVIEDSERRQLLENGSLLLESVIGSDAANYTCRAENNYGSDVITYSVSVQVDTESKTSPKPPVLSVVAVTASTIQVNWLSGSNGGSPIIGFVLKYRKAHDIWQEVNLGPKNRTFTYNSLQCGTAYKFSISALNKIGRSDLSNIVSTKTNGSAPIAPPTNEILKTTNVTSIELDLRTWQIDFCTIGFYSIKYTVLGEANKWVEVTNSISWNTTLFTVEDLNPATRYRMKVSAHSHAGSTECNLIFSTLTYSGSTLEPLYVMHKNETYFYEKFYIMVPLCGAFLVLIVLCVGLAFYCSRRRQLIRYKENSSNIRRDITAETSLMNDLDKRINYELESPQDARFNSRNVNLLISLNSDENLVGSNGAWCFHDSSKTTSDNASIGRSGITDAYEDANINPYATFNELKLEFNDNPTYHKADPNSDDDSVSLEKAEAQKAMLVQLEKTDEPKYVSKGTSPDNLDHHSYDNQAMVLSPRKYASADQIHALFTMAPPRPQSAYSKNRSHGTRSTPSDKGSQRHSLISSVTTVSSSRDELLEAFENLNRNPPPPVVYETEADSLSQPTDSSTGTEAGICLFTQSPPQPDEQREASCEVPRYETSEETNAYKEERDRDRHMGGHQRHGSNAEHMDLRGSGSRRNKNCCSQKSKETVSRGTSMNSRYANRPKPTEEVTYMFNVDDSPSHSARKPQSFEEKLLCAREGRETSIWRRGGRRTPHSRVRYDTTIQTPGSADNKPLVSTQLMSDATPEEEETVSLLDRYYRPLPSRRSNDGAMMLEDDDDKGYTENFTVV